MITDCIREKRYDLSSVYKVFSFPFFLSSSALIHFASKFVTGSRFVPILLIIVTCVASIIRRSTFPKETIRKEKEEEKEKGRRREGEEKVWEVILRTSAPFSLRDFSNSAASFGRCISPDDPCNNKIGK